MKIRIPIKYDKDIRLLFYDYGIRVKKYDTIHDQEGYITYSLLPLLTEDDVKRKVYEITGKEQE